MLNKFIALPVMALALSVPQCLWAAEGQTQAKPKSETVMRDGEKVRIKRMEKNGVNMVCEIRKPVGSNLRKKVCMSEEEYEAHAQAAKDYLDRTFENGYAGPGSD